MSSLDMKCNVRHSCSNGVTLTCLPMLTPIPLACLVGTVEDDPMEVQQAPGQRTYREKSGLPSVMATVTIASGRSKNDIEMQTASGE